jgi:hypothetical protein
MIVAHREQHARGLPEAPRLPRLEIPVSSRLAVTLVPALP